jgi:hypothetical protein
MGCRRTQILRRGWQCKYPILAQNSGTFGRQGCAEQLVISDTLNACTADNVLQQDDDAYYRDFRQSGILSHYAYVRKSNYLLPQMIVPLLRDAVAGRSFIDPEIESRVQEVRRKDEQSPMALLEPNEQAVARMLAQGMTNEQIAARLGFRDIRKAPDTF